MVMLPLNKKFKMLFLKLKKSLSTDSQFNFNLNNSPDRLCIAIFHESFKQLKDNFMRYKKRNYKDLIIGSIMPEDFNELGKVYIVIYGFHLPENHKIKRIEINMNDKKQRKWYVNKKTGWIIINDAVLLTEPCEILINNKEVKNPDIFLGETCR